MTKKQLLQWMFAGSFVVLGAVACGSEDEEEDATPAPTTSDCQGLTYSKDIAAIVTSRCATCHGATPVGNNVQLATYANLQTHKDHVYNEVNGGKMPVGGWPATDAASKPKLLTWISCGMPQ
jgi:uncharacterized membrane protein